MPLLPPSHPHQALTYLPSRTRYFELSAPSPDALPSFHEGSLEPDEVELWLQSSAERWSSSYSMLRVLFGNCLQDKPSLPFSEEGLKSVVEGFGVPEEFFWMLEEPVARVWKGMMKRVRGEGGEEGDGWAFIFKFGVHATGYCSVSVSFEPNSRLVSVLLLAQTAYPELDAISNTLKHPSYRLLSTQPMLVPLVVANTISLVHTRKVQGSNRRLSAIEEHLGQHTYQNRPRGDPLDADFVITTTSLNSNSNVLGINESRLNSLMLALKRMQEYNAKIVTKSRLDTVLSRIEDMDDLIEHLYNYAANLLTQNTAEQKRTQTHLAVVFNFMAQRDNLVNISLANDSRRIAAASKRDSTAMKTISVVTMVFLPGTYIAALFAIPLFNWGADEGAPVVSSRFWYYWATTLPLTAAVLLCWIVWEPLRDRLVSIGVSEVFGMRRNEKDVREQGEPQQVAGLQNKPRKATWREPDNRWAFD